MRLRLDAIPFASRDTAGAENLQRGSGGRSRQDGGPEVVRHADHVEAVQLERRGQRLQEKRLVVGYEDTERAPGPEGRGGSHVDREAEISRKLAPEQEVPPFGGAQGSGSTGGSASTIASTSSGRSLVISPTSGRGRPVSSTTPSTVPDTVSTTSSTVFVVVPTTSPTG